MADAEEFPHVNPADNRGPARQLPVGQLPGDQAELLPGQNGGPVQNEVIQHK